MKNQIILNHAALPPWCSRIPLELLYQKSEKYSVPIKILAALVQTESSGNPYACKYEPKYKYTWNLKKFALLLGTDIVTIKTMQKTSYGLCQVMGGVYFERGGKRLANSNVRT